MTDGLTEKYAYLAQSTPEWTVNLHAVSDLLLVSVYFAISIVIIAAVRRRPLLETRKIAMLFAAFLLMGGVTQLTDLITIWWPIHVEQAVLKTAAGICTLALAAMIFPLIPKVAALPSRYELQQANARLSQEIVAHERTLSELRAVRDNLERRVEERTEDLSRAVRKSKFMARELAHRSKNLLAVVVSMARQTVRSCETVEEFESRLMPRLQSLAAANDELVRNDWRGGDLERLIHSQLEPFLDPHRVTTSGPELLLSADAVQYVGLAIHELATNAAKHGALTGPSGRVRISWSLSDGKGQSERGKGAFRLSWIEDAATPATEPAGCGFGHVLLTKLVPAALSGSAELKFLTGGLSWTLEAPTEAVLGTSSAASAPT